MKLKKNDVYTYMLESKDGEQIRLEFAHEAGVADMVHLVIEGEDYEKLDKLPVGEEIE